MDYMAAAVSVISSCHCVFVSSCLSVCLLLFRLPRMLKEPIVLLENKDEKSSAISDIENNRIGGGNELRELGSRK